MDFSETYYKRNEKMAALQVPTISEVTQQLGKPLSEIFFNSCPESLESEMSLNPLEGPGPDLWISPSDILIDKVVLKPPLTIKYLRALTHQSILKIGEEIEEKIYRLLEEQKQRELYDLQDILQVIAEKEKKRAVNEAVELQHELFKEKLKQLNDEFEQLLQEALEKLEAQLKETYETLYEERMKNVLDDQHTICEKKIDEAVSELLDSLTKKFLDDLREQEKSLEQLFELKLLGQKEKYKKLMKNEQEVFQVLLKQLKHNLHCNNISNLMYVLCVERRTALKDKQEIINDYDAQINDLKKSLSEKNEEIENLRKSRDEKQRQCDVRERCLSGVICQFQKFINFALKASPTQAEFLLSVKKMMTFELTQAIVQTSPQKHLCKGLMPWKKPQPKSETAVDMRLRDYHNCLNVKTRDVQVGDVEEGSLKAFNFNSKLYVREDFRNKFTQGFPVKLDSMIWNKDVENLVKLLKHSLDKDTESIDESIQNQRSQNSSVHFGSRDMDAISYSLERQDSTKVGLLGTVDSLALQKSIKSDWQISPNHSIEKLPAYDILAAKDSLSITNVTKCAHSAHSGKCEDVSAQDSKIFKTVSTATFKLPKPTKKQPEEIFRNISSATINLGDGKKKSGVYRFSPKISIEKKTCKMSTDIKKQKSLITHRNSLEVLKDKMDRKGIKKLMHVSYEELKNPLATHFAVDIPIEGKKLDVNFKQVADLYTTLSEVDEPWRKIQPEINVVKDEVISEDKKVEADDFFKKENVAKIMGHIGTEHLECTNDFTVHRLHSIMDVLKKDNSLIRMFTSCTQ